MLYIIAYWAQTPVKKFEDYVTYCYIRDCEGPLGKLLSGLAFNYTAILIVVMYCLRILSSTLSKTDQWLFLLLFRGIRDGSANEATKSCEKMERKFIVSFLCMSDFILWFDSANDTIHSVFKTVPVRHVLSFLRSFFFLLVFILLTFFLDSSFC